MFWRSVVGKLAMTILLLVSFVLFILTVLLLEFFENFHVQEAEKRMIQTANKIALMLEEHNDKELLLKTTERVKDPSTQIIITFDDEMLISKSNDEEIAQLNEDWFQHDIQVHSDDMMDDRDSIYKQRDLPNSDGEVMVVGLPVEHNDGAIFVYQSLDVIDQTKAETTRIIFLAAGIAIILTTIFAFFLSTRITAPLIKMRKAAFDLTRGEFNTKVPILTHDEIGELAMAFNRMGKQLKFHITALHQEKEQLSSILSSMADGVITLDRNGNIVVTNPPAEQFLDEWMFENNTRQEKNTNKLPTELLNVLEQVVSEERELLQEMIIQGRNYVLLMTPLYDQSFVRGAVAVIRDMTEERQLDKLRKDFIANVSHELRTPISLLQGYSEAIVDDIAETKEDKNELAQIIYDESLRMSRLVDDLLDLARMEAGHIELKIKNVYVKPFIQRIIHKFKRITDEQGVRMNVETNLHNEQTLLDADRMEQVLTNLVDNAIRHIDDNGKIDIFVRNDEKELFIEVSDNGSGIAEEDLPFVFERFYKVDKSRKRNQEQKGTGLGLAIAKNIIDAHQGNISVKSKLNIGTTFTITIPNDISGPSSI